MIDVTFKAFADKTSYGEYSFVELPRTGELVTFPDESEYRVKQVEHALTQANGKPTVIIYLENA